MARTKQEIMWEVWYLRNDRGQKMERAKRVGEAIQQYEANVVELADTPYSYTRLRIIYSRRKQYDEALRVCRRYVEMAESRGLQGRRTEEFQQWISKLQAKADRQEAKRDRE